jgi:aryl-alcohol dehydrogenase-like predicted oxidoreductase
MSHMKSTTASSGNGHDGQGQSPAAASGTFRIGNDLPVHRLGFGAMRVTGKGIWGEPRDKAEAIAVLRRSLELGVTFIDTADSYGPDVSERLIAEALFPYPQGLVIGTKAGLVRPGPDQWVTNGRPAHLRAACDGSLRRLRLDRIDLYQLHRIDAAVPAADQIGTLKECRPRARFATSASRRCPSSRSSTRSRSSRSSACRTGTA